MGLDLAPTEPDTLISRGRSASHPSKRWIRDCTLSAYETLLAVLSRQLAPPASSPSRKPHWCNDPSNSCSGVTFLRRDR